MRIILTGGGTAGHINPALAVAEKINTMSEKGEDNEILFIGTKGGMEEKLVPAAGYSLETFLLGGMERGISFHALKTNLRSARRMIKAYGEIKKLITEFKPDAVMGTGGFVSYPAIRIAQRKGIPTFIHESNVKPGKANMRLSTKCTAVMVGSPDTIRNFPKGSNCVVTGNPLRSGIKPIDKSEAKKKLGIEGNLVYSAWGSLGAKQMNKISADLAVLESKKEKNFTHIHSTGLRDSSWFAELLNQAGFQKENARGIEIREYVSNAPDVIAASDLLLCRAGAMTISEICASGTPAIIVPSPHVVDDHQRYNARSLSDRGAAVYLEEEDASAEKLYEMITNLLNDPAALEEMSKKALALAVYDAADRICSIIRKSFR